MSWPIVEGPSVLCDPPSESSSVKVEWPEVTAAYRRVGEALGYLRSVLKTDDAKANVTYGEEEIEIGRWAESDHEEERTNGST